MFTREAGEWEGQNVFKANGSIVEKLRSVGALLHAKNFSHSYPHCWRCHNPLIFLATEQWFVSVDHNGLRANLSTSKAGLVRATRSEALSQVVRDPVTQGSPCDASRGPNAVLPRR